MTCLSKREFGEQFTRIYPVGYSRVKFITGDGLSQEKTSFEIYTTPFQSLVWLLLFLSVNLTSLFLCLVYRTLEYEENRRGWRELFEASSFWLYRILLEQPEREMPIGEGSKMRADLKWICSMICGFWLLMGLVITNGYRGIIMSICCSLGS